MPPPFPSPTFPLLLLPLLEAVPVGEEVSDSRAGVQEPCPASMNTCLHSSSSTAAAAHLQRFKGTPRDEAFKSPPHPLHGAAARSWLQLWMLDVTNNSKHNN